LWVFFSPKNVLTLSCHFTTKKIYELVIWWSRKGCCLHWEKFFPPRQPCINLWRIFYLPTVKHYKKYLYRNIWVMFMNESNVTWYLKLTIVNFFDKNVNTANCILIINNFPWNLWSLYRDFYKHNNSNDRRET